MKKYRIKSAYRFVAYMLALLFVVISGCKSRSVQKNEKEYTDDGSKLNDSVMIHESDSFSTKKQKQIADSVVNHNRVKPKQDTVIQTTPSPFEPATAYGTQYDRFMPLAPSE
jgi:hypothetical protein